MTTKIPEELELSPDTLEEETGIRPSRREVLTLGGMAVAAAAVGCGGDDPIRDAAVSGDADADASDTTLDASDADADELDEDSGGDADADSDADSDSDADADADEEADADEGPSPIGPVFLLHLTDTHLNVLTTSAPALAFALDEAVTAVNPDLTVVSGDLVDEGYDEEFWESYEETMLASSWDQLMDVPGNHDTHSDFSLAGFLRHSVTGQATATTSTQRVIEASGRRVRLVGINTASAGDRLRNLTGFLEGGQVDDLIATIEADPEPVDATIIVGHHPMRGLNGLELHGTAGNLRRLIEATDAWAYLFGHVHLYNKSWHQEVMHLQAPTLGKPNFLGPAGFCLLGLDDEGPVAQVVNIEEDGTTISASWPQVLITRPVAPQDGNPHAYPLPRNTPGQLLRAGVFNPTAIDNVSFRIDGGDWQTMLAVGNWYEAEFTTTDSDSMTLEVQAVSSEGLQTREVTVPLE